MDVHDLMKRLCICVSLLMCLPANAAPAGDPGKRPVGSPGHKPVWHGTLDAPTGHKTIKPGSPSLPASKSNSLPGPHWCLTAEILKMREREEAKRGAIAKAARNSADNTRSLLDAIEQASDADLESSKPAQVRVGHTFEQSTLKQRKGVRRKYLEERGIVEDGAE